MPVFRLTLIALAASALIASTPPSLVAKQPYQIIDHWKIGGSGGWDYLLTDPPSHLLYITHGPRVEVLDTVTGKAVAAITGMKGTHGIALDDSGNFGYISDGGNNNVVVFDRHTYKIAAAVPAGTNPDGIVFEPTTRTVWAFNGRSNNVTVLDAVTFHVVSTLELPGKPEFPVADGRGFVYDNIQSGNEIVRFDARTGKLTATWPLTNCESPSGLAMDLLHRRLFAVCDGNKMAVIDADSGKQLASPEIGGGPDAAAFSATHQLAFSSNGDGTLTIIDAGNYYKVLENLPTARGARTMAYDRLTDRAFLVTAQLGPAPAPTEQNPHPRPAIVPDTFEVLVVGRNK